MAATIFAATLKVLALSDTIRTGKLLLDVKRLKLRMNAWEVMSGTMSKWTARVTQQVYRQIHTFLEDETTVSLT